MRLHIAPHGGQPVNELRTQAREGLRAGIQGVRRIHDEARVLCHKRKGEPPSLGGSSRRMYNCERHVSVMRRRCCMYLESVCSPISKPICEKALGHAPEYQSLYIHLPDVMKG